MYAIFYRKAGRWYRLATLAFTVLGAEHLAAPYWFSGCDVRLVYGRS